MTVSELNESLRRKINKFIEIVYLHVLNGKTSVLSKSETGADISVKSVCSKKNSFNVSVVLSISRYACYVVKGLTILLLTRNINIYDISSLIFNKNALSSIHMK